MAEQAYEWPIRMFFNVFMILIFLFIFLHPLWQLSKSRLAMIIVFSRAIGSLLQLFSVMPDYFMTYIFRVWPRLIIYFGNGCIIFTNTVLATHIMALAVNRAHSIIFPFHYNLFSTKKRNFYLICALLWLFSLIFATLEQSIRIWTNVPKTLWPYFIIHKICMGIGAICYLSLTCQLIWLKYKKNPTLSSGASTEKDQFRILFVCFSCLFISSLRDLVISPLASIDMSEIPSTITRWASFFTALFSVCTEEICLLFLVRDFRKDVKKQLMCIFCCFSKKSSSTNNIKVITTFPTNNTRTLVNNWTQKN